MKKTIAKLQVIKHSDQRYDTVGDWFYKDGYLRIRVSEQPDERYEFLIAIHELVEAYLCKHAGITQHDVDTFDMTHLGDTEPGELDDAPYKKQHAAALQVERFVCEELGLNWEYYLEVTS